MEKKEDTRVQWQDGVGNILIHSGEEKQTKQIKFRLGEIDWTWVLGIVGFILLVVVALCVLSKLNFRDISRRSKRKMKKKQSEARKISVQKKVKPSESIDVEAAKEASSPNIPDRTKTLLDLIDQTLSGEDSQPNHVSAVSLESLDGLASNSLQTEHSRRQSDASLTLSLVMDMSSTKPVFLNKYKKSKSQKKLSLREP